MPRRKLTTMRTDSFFHIHFYSLNKNSHGSKVTIQLFENITDPWELIVCHLWSSDSEGLNSKSSSLPPLCFYKFLSSSFDSSKGPKVSYSSKASELSITIFSYFTIPSLKTIILRKSKGFESWLITHKTWLIEFVPNQSPAIFLNKSKPFSEIQYKEKAASSFSRNYSIIQAFTEDQWLISSSSDLRNLLGWWEIARNAALPSII